MTALEQAQALAEEMTLWRRHIHAHPETAFEEIETSKYVADLLRTFGLDVHTGLAETGVVGVLANGGGPMIGLRADLDALDLDELTGLPHASQNPGKMHACGHDGHTAMLLGAAKILAKTRRFNGSVAFIFQPAEESEGGAERMVQEGLFSRFPIEQVYGLHNWPSMPEGHMAVGPGPMMAANQVFEMEISGQGGHAAMPHLGSDTIVAASQIVSALQTIASRRTDPQQACVVSVTQIHGGDTWNVIPQKVMLRGTIRWFDAKAGETVKASMREVCEGIANAMGCAAQLNFLQGYPATINTRENARLCADVMAELVGEEQVRRDPVPSMGAEDFSFMLNERPGSYAWLGTGARADCPKLHNPHYDFNDKQLPLGAAYWVRLAETLLA